MNPLSKVTNMILPVIKAIPISKRVRFLEMLVALVAIFLIIIRFVPKSKQPFSIPDTALYPVTHFWVFLLGFVLSQKFYKKYPNGS